jgi:hypothetical protein
MSNLVLTTKGEVERDKLEVKDIVTELPGSRTIATEYWYQGELVRRDVNVNMIGGFH